MTGKITEEEAVQRLVRFAVLLLKDDWPGDVTAEWWDAAEASGIIVRSVEPCPPKDECEWCNPNDPEERCWKYRPEVSAIIDRIGSEERSSTS